MNRHILLILIFSSIVGAAFSQLKPDSFIFRNDIDVNYNLQVLNNDLNRDSLKIYSVTKLGANAAKYSVAISLDSLYLNIFSSDLALDTGSFIYNTIHKNSTIDSSYIYYKRVSVTNTMYPGDANRDNLVNHFDIFPLGVFYGKIGYPRHLDDTAVSFSPKNTTNWFFQSASINAAHADIDGNGIINEIDFVLYQTNFGKSTGSNYTPSLSGTSPSIQLKMSIADTVDLFKDTGRLFIPVLINSPTKLNAYGIGYSYTVRVFNKSTAPLDSFYPYTNFSRTNIWNDNQTIFVKDTVSFKQHTNVGYVRKNQVNGDMDPQAGVIEVVTDDILIGIANKQDVSYVNIILKEVSLIDKDMKTIPISPITKRIYFRKASSSIQSSIQSTLKVYPTLINESFAIEKLNAQSENYTIYNTLGQEMVSGKLAKIMTYIDANQWTAGIYFIKLESMPGVIKLQKQ
jgi:hypothetical protein